MRRDLSYVDRLADAIKARLMEHPDKPCWSTEMSWGDCTIEADTELAERELAYDSFAAECWMLGVREACKREAAAHYQHEVLDSIVGLAFEYWKIEDYKNGD